MNFVEFRQLQHFYLVAKLGSITKVAKRLHMAQPAISISIQKLEEEIGVQLIDRNQKPLALTAEGQAFWQGASDVLERLQDMIMEMDDYKYSHKGTIRIGIPPMLGAFLIPRIFKEFREIYPGIELLSVEEGTLAIQKQLEQGDLDVAVIMMNDLSANLEVVPITTGELCVCLPAGHPLDIFEKIPIWELKEEPFVLLQESTYVRKLILQECAKHGFTPKIAFSSSQIITLLGLVEQGVGITFLLESIVKKEADLIVRPLAQPISFKAGLAWSKNRYISNATRAFIDFIKAFSLSFEEGRQEKEQ